MRLIDADALKENMFHYAAPEMVWDRGDIEHKINEMPTVDTIPIKFIQWLSKEAEKEIEKGGSTAPLSACEFILATWERFGHYWEDINETD